MIKIKKENLTQICNEFYENTKNYLKLDVCNTKEKRYIQQNLERIITCKPRDFKKIIAEVKANGLTDERLKKVFVGDDKYFSGYKKFSSKNTKSYNAYDLSTKLDVNVCPYCNRNYIHTVKSVNDKSTRPQFDHFICKKKHPIFAMSFYNLIPSCSICNSSIKGQSKFYYETHIHPYFDDFNKIKKFTIDKKLLSLINKEDEFNIIFENKDGNTASEETKANNHIKDFALEALYNSHKDKVLELVDVSRAYNEASFENLVNEFAKSTQIFKNTNDVKRLMLCHHIEDENIDKRPLNKLVKDISEELGLV